MLLNLRWPPHFKTKKYTPYQGSKQTPHDKKIIPSIFLVGGGTPCHFCSLSNICSFLGPSLSTSALLDGVVCIVSHRCWEHEGGGGRGGGGEGSSKFGEGWLESIHGGKHGGKLKTLLKNTCQGVHLLVKLPAISLQACKFTKNELLHTYFSRILARF